MVTQKDIPILSSKSEEYKFISENRWPDGKVICPSCGSNDVKSRAGAKNRLIYLSLPRLRKN